jgi:Domain of unknown function (DUF5753)
MPGLLHPITLCDDLSLTALDPVFPPGGSGMVAQRDPYDLPAVRAFAAELAAWRRDAGSSKIELAETPPGFNDFVAREAAATTMHVFEPSVIKGIFQTREYAYEVMKAGRGPEEIEQLVAKRMDRQEILNRPEPPRIVAIFDEVAIRREIGDPEVMRGQIGRLIEVAEQPSVTMQIVPNGRGAYPGLMGAFTILGFDDSPEAVYAEGHVGGQITADRAIVREYKLRYDLIRGAAVSADESLKLLRVTLESL